MLLRPEPPSSEDIFITMAAASGTHAADELLEVEPLHEHYAGPRGAADGSDIWGSAPASPTLTPLTTTTTTTTTTGSASASFAASHHHHHHHHQAPSDMPRLRREHVTAGYRDGVAAAKAAHAQAGFDEGFGLGATLGAAAGRLLGLLEGIARAAAGIPVVAGGAADGIVGAESAREVVDHAVLLAAARSELSVRSMFAPEYWAPDGTWRFEVPVPMPAPVPVPVPVSGGRSTGSESETGEPAMVFADVAAAHPLIRKWDAIVQHEVARWGVDLAVLSDDERDGGGHEINMEEDGDDGDGEEEKDREGKRQPLDAKRRLVRAAAPNGKDEALAW